MLQHWLQLKVFQTETEIYKTKRLDKFDHHAMWKSLSKIMIDIRIDEKACDELKKIHNHYLDKRQDIMNSTKISSHEIFGDISRNMVLLVIK